MGQLTKAPKGEISIANFEGRIGLRWRYNQQRYSLNLPFAYSTENMHHATVRVAEIKLDILKGEFDATLEKYRPKQEKVVLPLIEKAPRKAEAVYISSLAGKFLEWTKQVKNINIDHSIDYWGVYKLLQRYAGVPLESITAKLSQEKWVASTYNKRLNFLSSFFSWLLDTGIITINPLLSVNKKRDKKKRKNERRKPLTESEISAFLEAIRLNTFCHKAAPYKHSFYYPFLRFIFLTGVRNAEAIGLRVRHIDFENKQIEVSEAFARTVKGTHHAARISKGTKTDNTRYLPLTAVIQDLLLPLIQNKEPENLVFTSPRGLSIDDRMLKRRVIKPVMLALGIGDRDLYAARHSFGTRAVQQGLAVTDVAYLMGHSTVETTIRNYVEVGKRAVELPLITTSR